MEIIKGKFAEAKVFSNDLEQYARVQLQMICDNEVAKGSVTEPGTRTRKIISTRAFGIVVDVSEYISKMVQNRRLLTSVLLYKDMIYYGFRINASKMLFTFIETYLVHATLSKFR